MSYFYAGFALATATLVAVACVGIGPPIDGDVSCLDEDHDGFVARTTCPDPELMPPGGEADCDDTRADRNPDMDELGDDDLWYDGIDQDCDGEDVIDQDGDLYPGTLEEDWEPRHGGLSWPPELLDERDCDDRDPTRYPDNPDESRDCHRDPSEPP